MQTPPNRLGPNPFSSRFFLHCQWPGQEFIMALRRPRDLMGATATSQLSLCSLCTRPPNRDLSPITNSRQRSNFSKHELKLPHLRDGELNILVVIDSTRIVQCMLESYAQCSDMIVVDLVSLTRQSEKKEGRLG